MAEWAATIDVPTPGEHDGSEPVGPPPSGFATWHESTASRWPSSLQEVDTGPGAGRADHGQATPP